jgi:glutamine synthetase
MHEEILSLLASDKVRFIRIVWCDNANIIRAKAVHRMGFTPTCMQHGVGISEAQQAVPVMFDAPSAGSGLGPVGEVRLVPDLTTAVMLPYAPGHARVMGDMMRDGKPWPLCPRTFLKRMISAASQMDLQIQAAFENEFYLLKPPPDSPSVAAADSILPPVPADQTLFAATLAMDMHRAVIDDIADALVAQGMMVEQYYPESGPGQQEISIRHTDPLSAADQQIAFRETVKAVAMHHGLRATFLPKPFENQAGSGCHLHLSLWRNGSNLIPDGSGGLSGTARSFTAGILSHLLALMALTTPSINSYRRIRPHCWSGAFRCWGFNNREAAIRVPTHPSPPSPMHLELKTVDASSNPYLALGAVLAAGLDGICRGLQPADPVSVDPGTLPEAERTALGIDALPTRLGESMEELRKDGVLMEALGPDLGKAFLAVRQAEWDAMKDWTLEREVGLLVDRY